MTSTIFSTTSRLTTYVIWFSFVLLLVVAPFKSPEASPATISIETSTATHKFYVEIMRTPGERARGLMFRQFLAEDHGMLFDFQTNDIARMWMKNTYIPLDMLFIQEDGTISDIAANTRPHSLEVIASASPVRYVLEINAGLSAALSITTGDKVVIPK